MGLSEVMHVKHQAQCLAKSKFSVNVSYKNSLAIYQPIATGNQRTMPNGAERKGKIISYAFIGYFSQRHLQHFLFN